MQVNKELVNSLLDKLFRRCEEVAIGREGFRLYLIHQYGLTQEQTERMEQGFLHDEEHEDLRKVARGLFRENRAHLEKLGLDSALEALSSQPQESQSPKKQN